MIDQICDFNLKNSKSAPRVCFLRVLNECAVIMFITNKSWSYWIVSTQRKLNFRNALWEDLDIVSNLTPWKLPADWLKCTHVIKFLSQSGVLLE